MSKRIYTDSILKNLNDDSIGRVRAEIILFKHQNMEKTEKFFESKLYLSDINFQQENKQLKENRNKLKEKIKKLKEIFDSGIWCELDTMSMFNYLLHNLESGDSNE